MSGKMRGKVIGTLILVAMIVYDICGYPAPVSLEAFEPDFEAIIEELERQGLAGRVDIRAVRPRNQMIRKSLSPSDFRLRFGKRSVTFVPAAQIYVDTTQEKRSSSNR